MDAIDNSVSAATVSKYDYSLDGLGRRTSVVTSGPAFAQTDTTSYTHSDRSELLGADATTNANHDFTYTYDPAGNRTESSAGILPATTYTPNALNQCTATASPTESFTYDDDGNLVQDSTWTYTWDAENRLVCAESSAGVPPADCLRLDFAYDYLGRRVQKKVYSSADAGQTWTSEADHRFVYDGWSVVLILDGTNGNSVLQRFTHGLDLSQSIGGAGGVGGLLAVQNVGSSLPAKTYYYAHDANGNVTQLIDGADGSVAAHYEYGPFGEAVVVTEDADVAQSFAHGGFRFSGKLLDSETGLYYYGYRYYDPGHGRWLNRDPLEEQGGINLYGFVGNDPINAIDPLGLTTIDVSVGTPEAAIRRQILEDSDGAVRESVLQYGTLRSLLYNPLFYKQIGESLRSTWESGGESYFFIGYKRTGQVIRQLQPWQGKDLGWKEQYAGFLKARRQELGVASGGDRRSVEQTQRELADLRGQLGSSRRPVPLRRRIQELTTSRLMRRDAHASRLAQSDLETLFRSQGANRRSMIVAGLGGDVKGYAHSHPPHGSLTRSPQDVGTLRSLCRDDPRQRRKYGFVFAPSDSRQSEIVIFTSDTPIPPEPVNPGTPGILRTGIFVKY